MGLLPGWAIPEKSSGGGGGPPAPAGGWERFYGLNFLAQTPGAFIDGVWVDENGVEWDAENTASTSTQEMSATNGLHRVTTNGTYSGLNRTGPILGVALADLGTIEVGDRLSVMWRGAFTPGADANGFGCILENAGKTLGLCAMLGQSSSAPVYFGQDRTGVTSWVRAGASYTRVIELTFDGGPVVVFRDAGVWSGEWPEPGLGTIIHGFGLVPGSPLVHTPFDLPTARFGFATQRFAGAPESKVYGFEMRRQPNVAA